MASAFARNQTVSLSVAVRALTRVLLAGTLLFLFARKIGQHFAGLYKILLMLSLGVVCVSVVTVDRTLSLSTEDLADIFVAQSTLLLWSNELIYSHIDFMRFKFLSSLILREFMQNVLV